MTAQPQDKSLDLLGVKPIAESISTVTKGVVAGAAAFLGRICLPAAEEFGLLLRDKVSNWRARNAVNVATKAELILDSHGGAQGLQAHPRIVGDILDNGSWSESDDVQQMWAGLLASSCDAYGKDDSNLVFINMLKQLTTAQAKFISHICATAEKRLTFDKLVYAKELTLSPESLFAIWGSDDVHRIDRELDHLRNLGLMDGGFPMTTEQTLEQLKEMKRMDEEMKEMNRRFSKLGLKKKDAKKESTPQQGTGSPDDIRLPPFVAEVTPSAIALHLFVRCQGFRGSPAEFFKCRQPTTK